MKLPPAAMSLWTWGARAAGEPRGKGGDASRPCNIGGSQRPETRDGRITTWKASGLIQVSTLRSDSEVNTAGAEGAPWAGRNSGEGGRLQGRWLHGPPHDTLSPQVLAGAGRFHHPLQCDFSIISLEAHSLPWAMWLRGGGSPPSDHLSSAFLALPRGYRPQSVPATGTQTSPSLCIARRQPQVSGTETGPATGPGLSLFLVLGFQVCG